jgi:ubiquinone/menaquinone biosynthesis C-methylase UbiE
MKHEATVIEQFTLQADAFASARPVRDEQALQLLVKSCEAGPSDNALDVACGPGLVVGAFAEVVRSAVGVDLTRAMIEKGRALVASKGLLNTSFKEGNVYSLPFHDAAFSIVTSRYAFHHILAPVLALREMARVCQPGGRIAVMDVISSDDDEMAVRFNQMEKLRDPSHVCALKLSALRGLFDDAGLPEPVVVHYQMHVELEGLLQASFPIPSDREVIREMISSSLADDDMGVNTRREEGKIFITYPIALLVARLE